MFGSSVEYYINTLSIDYRHDERKKYGMKVFNCFIMNYMIIIDIAGYSNIRHNVCCGSVLEAPYLESTEDQENNTLQIIGA